IHTMIIRKKHHDVRPLRSALRRRDTNRGQTREQEHDDRADMQVKHAADLITHGRNYRTPTPPATARAFPSVPFSAARSASYFACTSFPPKLGRFASSATVSATYRNRWHFTHLRSRSNDFSDCSSAFCTSS